MQVDLMTLDLSSFDSIRSFATKFQETKLPLHILMYALMSILLYSPDNASSTACVARWAQGWVQPQIIRQFPS
jgi:hypothetical protein